ncbi:hypothetical protein [Legionella maioricensis]|uniref:Uncharacterized protein n=1 Tax=Legionella maioricensis TaxID=2896528 RepID=A0A9X2D2N3_9GAMM|nr:hypothetical protein [Legionella maioricensis]MCL9685449.1 hypothetical protein [Legionella maioricensis]MCL9688751.1 hypothetical protein [Legionella maioricensis]
MRSKYCIHPLNPNNGPALECDPNSNEAVTSSDDNPSVWYFSNNNRSSGRDSLFRLGKIPHEQVNKLHTELSVFAGNIYKLILGNPYPQYFVGNIDQHEDFEFIDPFVRVCNNVENSLLWRKCLSIDDENLTLFQQSYSLDEIEKIPLKGLTSSLVAGLFLAEVDWNYENLVIAPDGTVVKIDPGLCINDLFMEETTEDILFKLKNLLLHYVYKIEDESYFPDLKLPNREGSIEDSYEDSEPALAELIHDNISFLFNNKKELFHTLIAISKLSDAVVEQAKKDFSPEFSDFSKKLVGLFLTRIEQFKNAADLLKGFKEYATPRPKQYAPLLNRHFFFSLNVTTPEVKEDSNSNFFYLQDKSLS